MILLRLISALTFILFSQAAFAQTPADRSVLPFPTPPSKSVAGPTLQTSKLAPWPNASHLPRNAPNILIILLDDVGFGLPDTFGGPIHTPTLSRLAEEGVSYNEFTRPRSARRPAPRF